jgi:peroxiredoxin Q/BCP
MNRIKLLLAGTAVFGLTLAAQTVTPPKTHLKVGDPAPDFTLPSATGDKVTLSSFRGKDTVVLAFFPAAFTGGCTQEMTNYQAGIDKFTGIGVKVYAISTDFGPTLAHWAKEMKLEFPMLSDHMRTVSKEYGVLMPEMGIANRATFVISPAGTIEHIEEGKGAVDPNGAETACKRIKAKAN